MMDVQAKQLQIFRRLSSNCSDLRETYSNNCRQLILRPATVSAHHNDLGHELANVFHQVTLRGHDVVDVLVGPRDFANSH